MKVQLHKNARTTPALRREIQQSPLSERALARKYNLSRMTIRKWKQRETVDDASHRPHELHTTLNEGQEAIVVYVRRTLLLPLDDLLVLTREFLHPAVSRSGLDRCLRRHGVSNLKQLIAEQQPEQAPAVKKTFKDYEPGYVHVDVKYLPQLDDRGRRYLFVAIDRASRWVYLETLADKSAASARSFLKRLVAKAPFVIRTVLTDNGKEFTDRFCATGERQPTGRHPFDQLCQQQAIDHRLIRPRRPQTNGMVERFNGRIAEILKTTHFDNNEHLDDTLRRYARLYNHHIPQRALGHITPVAALKEWQKFHPDLFRKRVYNHTGLDS